MVNDECAIHGYEPIPEKYYMICGECYHCFVTAGELLALHNERGAEVGLPAETNLDYIYMCPLCTHDF